MATAHDASASDAAREAAYAAIYAALPNIACQRLCHPACGPIVVPAREWERMERSTGGTRNGETLTCPHLDGIAGLCRAHTQRPLICRLWGVVETMACPWGCVPERWLSAEEAQALLDRAIALSDGAIVSAWRGWLPMLQQRDAADTDG